MLHRKDIDRTGPSGGFAPRASANAKQLVSQFSGTARRPHAENSGDRYRALTPTKSRTDLNSETEKALPSRRRNQKAVDDPPSRFKACTARTGPSSLAARIVANSASDTLLQIPRATWPSEAV